MKEVFFSFLDFFVFAKEKRSSIVVESIFRSIFFAICLTFSSLYFDVTSMIIYQLFQLNWQSNFFFPIRFRVARTSFASSGKFSIYSQIVCLFRYRNRRWCYFIFSFILTFEIEIKLSNIEAQTRVNSIRTTN